MSSASPPPTAPQPGDHVQVALGGETHSARVVEREWQPRWNCLDGLRIRVAIGGTTRTVTQDQLR